MLSVFSALLLGATSVCAIADDAGTPSSQQDVRIQVEKQRDQLSGASRLKTTVEQESSALLEVPIETEDAPAQVQQP
ncbi:hypothetical protein [Pseudomonas sp. NPDC089734]|uniref:hypothetical protein n=1 Tax=Pseudomonas sp. NPDC089734 TaxID=3364469 RepID=UPI00381E37CE